MYIENDTREFEVKAQLENERKNIKTFDDLVSFLEKVKDTCNTGYGTAPRAIAQAALSTAPMPGYVKTILKVRTNNYGRL